MNLLHVDVPAVYALLGWALLAPALGLAWRRCRGPFLELGLAEDLWLGGAVGIALLWTLEIKVGGGPRFGMLGSALFVLVFGPARGLLGLVLALLLHTGLDHGSWRNVGINGLLLAVVPALIAGAMQRTLEARLPRNPFVFMIGNGMFTTLAATAATSLALIATALASGAAPPVADLDAYLGAALLLAWSEAIVSGMLFSALVVFQPGLVQTYRPELYGMRR